MPTASPRRDRGQIEKATESAVQLPNDGKRVPEPVLPQATDFTKNFTGVFRHAKEEKPPFPAPEQAEMPGGAGPVAVMPIDHRRTREIGAGMGESAGGCPSSGDSAGQVTGHLRRESGRLFMTAGARLRHVWARADGQLGQIVESALQGTGRSRRHRGSMAEDIARAVSGGA